MEFMKMKIMANFYGDVSLDVLHYLISYKGAILLADSHCVVEIKWIMLFTIDQYQKIWGINSYDY